MRTARHALGAATIALASFLALSCNNSYGIFADVQGQKAQDGSKVFQKTSAYTAFRLNSYYYASTARLYRRSVSDTAWSQVNIGGSGSYYLRSVALAGPTIYALVGDSSSNVALYSSPDDGSSWAQIALPSSSVVAHGGSTYAFDSLYSANNELFAVGHCFVASSGTAYGTSYYDLYHYNAGFTAVANFTDINTKTIRGVVHDGAAYWFAAEDRLYSSADAANAGGASTPTSKVIWSISYTGGNLYIGTKDGYLYQGAFSAVNNLASVPLGTVVSVPGPAGFILVGTDTDDVNTVADGYYEGTFGSLKVGNKDAIVADTSSIYNTTVSSFPVHAFYWDPLENNLFVCISPGTSSASYYGLYMSHYNGGSSWSGWSAE
jgi:hypothetical protein